VPFTLIIENLCSKTGHINAQESKQIQELTRI